MTLNVLRHCGVLRPEIASALPCRYDEIMKIVQDERVEMKRIPCCVSGCMLFFGDDEGLTHCAVCGEAKSDANGTARNSFFHFPIIDRIRRLYGDSTLAAL